MVQIWREGGGGQIRKWNVIQFPMCPINVCVPTGEPADHSETDVLTK